MREDGVRMGGVRGEDGGRKGGGGRRKGGSEKGGESAGKRKNVIQVSLLSLYLPHLF